MIDSSEGDANPTRQPPLSIGEHDGLFLSAALDPPPKPGIFGLLGQYEILRQIGAGGMGVVFEARDPATNENVAIKLLRPELLSVPQAVRRFLVEARQMHELSHPHILRVLQVDPREQGPFYVMPFMSGGSLAGKVAQPLDPDQAMRIAIEIGSALVYAHVKGILHRDIKPANILMDQNATACLSDFGLVRTFFTDSVSGFSAAKYEGTAPYMSPNVAAGLNEDTRCDIYSFGATLYEMLTGTPPYEGRSTDGVVRKILSGPPAPIRELNAKAPLGLTKVAEGCMARELRDRYAEMADVVADLERVRAGQPPIGPHGSQQRIARPAIAAMLVVLLVAAGGILAIRSFRPVPHHAQAPVTTTQSEDSKASPATLPSTQPGTFASRVRAAGPNASTLDLSDQLATDADLALLEPLQQLVYLKLNGPGVTDAGLAHLSRLQHLRQLTLRTTHVTGAGFDSLAPLPRLEELLMMDCPVDDPGLDHIVRLTHLHQLRLGDSRVTDAGLSRLLALPNLQGLDLWGTPITDRGLKSVARMTSLQLLVLRSSRVTGDGVSELGSLKQLHWLDLRDAPAGGKGMQALGSLSRLSHLNLISTKVKDADLVFLKCLPHLTELELDQTGVSDNAMGNVVAARGLESLALSQTRVTDAGLKEIGRLANLKTLSLNGCPITDAGLEYLHGLSKLRTLRLACPRVTEEGVNRLWEHLPELQIKR